MPLEMPQAAGKPRQSLRQRPFGFTAVYGVLCLFAMFALASLAVDWGRVQLVRTELQRAADAASRAALSQLSAGTTAVQNAAVAFGANNSADSTSVVIDPVNDVEFGDWNSATRTFTTLPNTTGADAVRVTARRTAARGTAVPLVFGAIVGARTCDVSAVSTVALVPTTLDYSSGFSASSNISLNGSAAVSGSTIQLTSAVNNLCGTAWNTDRVPVGAFTTSFSFQVTSGTADGLTFCIQNNLTTSKGSGAGNLGSGGLTKSVAVKFDIYSNSGEGTSSTGVYINGATPYNVGSFDMSGSGINLRGGHVMNVTLAYDGTTLTQTVTDATTNATFSKSYTVDIPTNTQSKLAYVGFTGATGGASAIQVIRNWTYTGTGGESMVK